MALLVCVNDLVPHSVGSPRCPECGCEERVEQGSPEHEALLAGKSRKKPAAKTSASDSDGDKAGS